MAKSTIQFYDVVVVGAGPAGSTLAFELACNGIKVALLDKESFPRNKVCGGGISIRAASLLPFDISPVIEKAVYGVRLSYKLKQKAIRVYKEPIAYLVGRDRFDNFLNNRALETGAEFFEKQRVIRIAADNRKTTVYTETDAFSAYVIVGADGATGRVGKNLGLKNKFDYDVGLTAEVYTGNDELTRWGDFIGLDFGYIPGGYAWFFPKEDRISVGIGGPILAAKRLKSSLIQLLEKLGYMQYRIDDFKDGLLPLRNVGMRITSERGLLIGDAAGLVDAFTGEGIFYAIRSAQLATQAILSFLQGKCSSLEDYETEVDRELMPGLRTARNIAKLSTWLPQWLFVSMMFNEQLWRYLHRIKRN